MALLFKSQVPNFMDKPIAQDLQDSEKEQKEKGFQDLLEGIRLRRKNEELFRNIMGKPNQVADEKLKNSENPFKNKF